MRRYFSLLSCFLLVTAHAVALQLGPLPLQLPKDPAPLQRAPGVDANAPVDAAKQVENLRKLADGGDKDAAFQIGAMLLTGNQISQNAHDAESYFSKANMTSARKCFVAEAYIESVLPNRVEAAERWSLAAESACGFWQLSQWFRGVQLGPTPEKEVEFLQKGLKAPDDGFRRMIQARLGEIILSSTQPAKAPIGTAGERVAWMGQAARSRLGLAELSIASMYGKHGEIENAPEESLEWARRSARYGIPSSMGRLGQAAMTREISSLSFHEGLALFDLGARQDILGAVGEELQRMQQLTPEQNEELLNSEAAWQHTREETGGYYAKEDPLRLGAAIDPAPLTALIAANDPDSRLRLAYFYQSSGEQKKAEDIYRDVWQHSAAFLWMQLADNAAAAKQWLWARDLYKGAADAGSRPACEALSRMDEDGANGEKNPVSAYVWHSLSDGKGPAYLTRQAKLKTALTADQLKQADLLRAQWLLAHKEFWTFDSKAAEDIVLAQTQTTTFLGPQRPPGPPPPTPLELKQKADAGDKGSAYMFAIRLLEGDSGISANLLQVEHYARLGAVDAEAKVRISELYRTSPLFDGATQLRYSEKWALAAGTAHAYFSMAKLYNGKSDGIVKTEDEKKAVMYWRRAADSGDERFARLARMELGYRVDKGWSSGNLKLDAAWAHELALEMMGKEFYQIAGEYSYGRELVHNPTLYLLLAERAAIYNIDNAQGQVAKGIQDGSWKHGDSVDALAWMKLRAIKQDVDVQVIATAEEDSVLKAKLAERYDLLLRTRAESGAYYPQDDPLRTASEADVEARAREGDPEAQLRLGTLLEQRGTPGDRIRAIQLYRQIWSSAGREVRLTWGRALMNGISVSAAGPVARDDAGAEKWLRDAANAGSHEACALLSVIYAEGRGVKADKVSAESWRELSGDLAASRVALTPEEQAAVKAKTAEWTMSHPGW